jgi:esterase/lipase
MALLGDPVKDKKVYEATSPIAYIHDVRAPLLVLQGDNDPRVPKEEAVQVVELLKKDGRQSMRITTRTKAMASKSGKIRSTWSGEPWNGSTGI